MEIYCLPLIGDAWAIQLIFKETFKPIKKIVQKKFTRRYYPLMIFSL